MDIAAYHTEVRRTSAADFPHDETLKLAGLGIAGETGEVVWLLDDVLTEQESGFPYPNDSIDRWKAALTKEAGDVLWYTVYLLNALDWRLETLLEFSDLDTYQAFVRAETEGVTSLNVALRRLAAHAGAIADIIKKHALHGKVLDTDSLRYRLFQTVWYLTIILNGFAIALPTVLDVNRDKLRKRYKDGWSREAALARRDEQDDENDEESSAISTH